MKLIINRRFSFFAISIAAILYFSWWILGFTLVRQINHFANQDLAMSYNQGSYNIRFAKASFSGFPYSIQISLQDLVEEGEATQISYQQPVYIGYNFFQQKLYAHYKGAIIAAYKPVDIGFGSRIELDNYNISVSLKNIWSILVKIKHMLKSDQSAHEKQMGYQDLFMHLSKMELSSGALSIYDLMDKTKFYEQTAEKISLSKTQSSGSIETITKGDGSEIKQVFSLEYLLNSMPSDQRMRRVARGMLYMFSPFWQNSKINMHSAITLIGSLDDITNLDFAFKSDLDISSPLLNISKMRLELTSNQEDYGHNISVNFMSGITIKPELYEEFINFYQIYNFKKSMQIASADQLLDSFAKYSASNEAKELKARFSEQDSYNIRFKGNWQQREKMQEVQIEDFSLESDKFAIAMQNKTTLKSRHLQPIFTEGLVLLRNYPIIAAYCTDIYFSNIAKIELDQNSQDLYKDATIAFLRNLADETGSESNDIVIQYELDYQQPFKSKIGGLRFLDLGIQYKIALYQTLLDKTGYEGNLRQKIRNIAPELDVQEPMLKRVIDKIGALKKKAVQ